MNENDNFSFYFETTLPLSVFSLKRFLTRSYGSPVQQPGFLKVRMVWNKHIIKAVVDSQTLSDHSLFFCYVLRSSTIQVRKLLKLLISNCSLLIANC